MIHLTVGNLLDGGLNLDTRSHGLYAVHDGDVVFYVGKSYDPIGRLLAHMGQSRRPWNDLSQLGRLIKDNLPVSRGWVITLLMPGDCGVETKGIDKGITKEEWDRQPQSKYVPWTPGRELDRSLYHDADVDLVEIALIRFCRPCLNCAYNPEPSPLPDRYIEDNDGAAAIRATLAAFGEA